jgi:hypothetical protein
MIEAVLLRHVKVQKGTRFYLLKCTKSINPKKRDETIMMGSFLWHFVIDLSFFYRSKINFIKFSQVHVTRLLTSRSHQRGVSSGRWASSTNSYYLTVSCLADDLRDVKAKDGGRWTRAFDDVQRSFHYNLILPFFSWDFVLGLYTKPIGRRT